MSLLKNTRHKVMRRPDCQCPLIDEHEGCLIKYHLYAGKVHVRMKDSSYKRESLTESLTVTVTRADLKK